MNLHYRRQQSLVVLLFLLLLPVPGHASFFRRYWGFERRSSLMLVQQMLLSAETIHQTLLLEHFSIFKFYKINGNIIKNLKFPNATNTFWMCFLSWCVIWVIKFSHSLRHLNMWSLVGATIWQGLIGVLCWRKCVTGGKLWEFKNCTVSSSLYFLFTVQEVSLQLLLKLQNSYLLFAAVIFSHHGRLLAL